LTPYSENCDSPKMRYDEAVRTGEWIRGLSLPAGAVCLNIGSSTEEYRTLGRPHMDRFIFAPLRGAGVRVLHCDLKAEPGVDLVGDVLDKDFQRSLGHLGAQLLICSNLLEHLADPLAFARACGGLLSPSGHALFTVPSSYPYHPDPIDTLYRPTPQQLAGLFPGWRVIKAEQLTCGSFRSDLLALRDRPGLLAKYLAKYLARLAIPFYKPRFWLAHAHHALWLFRNYRVSMLLVQKPKEEVEETLGRHAMQINAV
jgi:SAM-dependent methyltransferase